MNRPYHNKGRATPPPLSPVLTTPPTRIGTLTRIGAAKDATIQSSNATIDYMEQQLKKLRDLVHLLRMTVDDCTNALDKHSLPHPPILQTCPAVDERLVAGNIK